MYFFISLISLTFYLFSGNSDKLAELLPINLTRNSERSKKPDNGLKLLQKHDKISQHIFFHHTCLISRVGYLPIVLMIAENKQTNDC